MKKSNEVKVNSNMVEKIEEQNKRIASHLLNLMESDGLKWVKDWHFSANAGQHGNPCTGTIYSGRNAWITAAMAAMCGWDDTRWMTEKQMDKAGYKFKDGVTPVPVYIEKWKPCMGARKVEVKDENGNVTEEWRSFRTMKLVGGYIIYNGSQIDGLPAIESDDVPSDAITAIADKFIATSRCKVIERGSKDAFYSPLKDSITVPKRAQFDTTEGFLRTLLHEMVHSTSKPLYRESKCKRWGDSAYAFEELVAELGSAFTAAAAGIDIADANYTGTYAENHAAYLKSWLKGCDNKETAMFNAAALATAASIYLYNNYKAA